MFVTNGPGAIAFTFTPKGASSIAAVGLTVGVLAYLHRTRMGLWMRSVADDRDVSGLLGINILRVETWAWTLSGVFAGFTGVMLATLVRLDSGVLTFLVIPAMAAAIVGRLNSLTLALIGGIRAGSVDVLKMMPYRRAKWGLRRSFQAEQIVGDLSTEDNVQVMLDSLDLTTSEKSSEMEKAISFTGLDSRRHVIGAALTLRERRMAEIAKTLVGGPRIVMLDEPGGGFSARETEQLRDLILEIPAEFGAQVLLIDHDVELIRAVCKNTLVIDFGKKIADGKTADVLENPRVRAAYLGEEVFE